MKQLLSSIRAEITAIPAAIRSPAGAVLTLSAVAVSAAVLTKSPATAYFCLIAAGALVLLYPWRMPGERALKLSVFAVLCIVATVSRLMS